MVCSPAQVKYHITQDTVSVTKRGRGMLYAVRYGL
jgi:hypothetical protein